MVIMNGFASPSAGEKKDGIGLSATGAELAAAALLRAMEAEKYRGAGPRHETGRRSLRIANMSCER